MAKEAGNGGGSDEEEMVGPSLSDMGPAPKKRKVLDNEADYLRALPTADAYERSYMHRDTVTHVAVTSSSGRGGDFIITASVDGHVKFWKKKGEGLEFAKHFRAHLQAVQGLAVSHNSQFLASISADKSCKVFDVANFDLIAMIPLDFVPSCVEWLFKKGSAQTRLAIADSVTGFIHLFDPSSGSTGPIGSVDIHSAPVTAMRFNEARDVVISTDEGGRIEYWSATSLDFPTGQVAFKYKVETDLFALAKAKTVSRSLEVSKDGAQFSTYSTDRRVRVFRFATGKLRNTYREDVEAAGELQVGEAEHFKLDAIDFGRRLAAEKDLDFAELPSYPNAVFDETGNFILYASLLGIKVVNLVNNRVVRILGKGESAERFLQLALYQGAPRRGLKGVLAAASSQDTRGSPADPTLVVTALKRQRLFLFTQREPAQDQGSAVGRDIFNERPLAEEGGAGGVAITEAEDAEALPRGAVMHTSKGDIFLKLFPDECPKAVTNFTTHAKQGYYDATVFHRVIKGFMIQGGDPLGDGTGGESIWGGTFPDEFSRTLRHDRPYTLSSANAGPHTNGSQFFITTVSTPWLDSKHTVFGRVVRGADVVQVIERSKTDRFDKPVDDVKILSFSVTRQEPV